MTAIPHCADSYERHQCHSATTQKPKRDAHSMHDRHTLHGSCHPRDVVAPDSQAQREARYVSGGSPALTMWDQRSLQHVPAPSLGGSMRLENANATATWGPNGLFAGSRTVARPAAPAQEGREWTQTRERYASRTGDKESSDSESYPPLISRGGSRAGMLPQIPSDACAKPTESDIIFGTSSTHRRERTPSWDGESVRLPPIRMDEKRCDSPHDPAFPPAKRPCVQLPPFPELIQTSLSSLSLASSTSPPRWRGSFASSASSYSGRRSTLSPSPSPSPSIFSADAHSSSQSVTDTDPTEDEDVVMGEQIKRNQGAFAIHPHPTTTVCKGRRPSPPLDDADYAPMSQPQLQLFGSNVFVRVEPQLPTGESQGRRAKRQSADASGEGSSKPHHRGGASEQKTPPQKKYRFVASKLSGDVSSSPGTSSSDGDQQGHPVAEAPSGSKRKYTDSPCAASSANVPIPTVSPSSRAPDQAPGMQSSSRPKSQSQGQACTPTEPPKRRGRPPRPAYDIESVAPIDPDSPEGQGQFPVYCYQGEEQPMVCQFDKCGALLTGKKSDATSHLKEHFADVAGRMLVCPWDAVDEHGGRALCGKKFKDSANMGRHVATKHLLSEKYECGKCHRAFARRDAALRHMKTMCSPEKEQRRAARRMAEKDVESEDENDGDKSGSSKEE